MDLKLKYSLDDFCEVANELTAEPLQTEVSELSVKKVELDFLPRTVPDFTLTLINKGDDPNHPRGGLNAHFRTRSEVVFRVACDLARANCSVETIAGILINPELEISNSILEKKNPRRYALRQARAAC